MRIGLVCPYSFSRPGGVQNHVLGLGGWLAAQGHQVRLLAPGEPTRESLARHGLSARAFTSSGRGIPLRYNGSVARVGFGPASELRVRRWLEHGRFDVVHLHEPITPSISLLALASAGVPVVATFHTATPGSRTMQLAYRIAPWAARRIDASIAVSRVAARVVSTHGGPEPVVVGNGITVSEHRQVACQGRWRGGEHPRIVFIGRFDEPRKGLDILLAAVPELRRRHPGIDIVVIGHGHPRAVPGVRFVGPLEDATRNRLLEHCDVFLAPHTGRESFGIVLLEALASGAPVVASDLPAFREVVSDDQGPVATLFTPGDAHALARAVLDSLAMPRDALLERGRTLAQRYDWSVVGPLVEQQYSIAQRAFTRATFEP